MHPKLHSKRLALGECDPCYFGPSHGISGRQIWHIDVGASPHRYKELWEYRHFVLAGVI